MAKYHEINKRDCIADLKAEFPDVPAGTLVSIVGQERQRKTKKSYYYHAAPQNIAKYYQRYVTEIQSKDNKCGVLLQIADEVDFSPALMAKLILEYYYKMSSKENNLKEEESITKSKISEMLRNPALIQDKHLGAEIKLHAIKGTITKIETFVEESGNHTPTKLDIKLKRVQKMNRKIDELKDQCYDIKDISESELQVIEADIQILFIIMKMQYQTNSKLKLEIKLPEIPLPVFRGRYNEWPSFKSQFDNIITNNNDLSESQKLYYLKASLQGDAKLLEAVDDSFESLITALKTRFENKRLLTETHINAILEIEKLTSESARDIRTMTDILSKNIRILKLLGFERNNLSDLILLNIILKKIDRETRKQFEQSIDSNQIPELNTFIMFLEKRSQTIDSINRSAPITHKLKQVPFHKGLGEITLRVKQKVNTVIQNKNGDFSTPLELLIVPYITTTSIHRMDATKVNIPSNIDLVDKDFDIPGEIDMLIGCELFFELLRPNKFRSPYKKWLFQKTVFGYIVVGSFDKFEEKSYCGLAINAKINSDNLNQQLQAFGEIEKVDKSSIEHSLEEEICETQYQNTHYRTEEGRYVVQLPLKKDPYCLGNSRFLAEVRLNQLWKKLSKHYELQTLYKSFLQEYIDLTPPHAISS
ncbi:integrase catalytic domain-containing protein [Trichonephila clavipes]|nr:integrase catalytic domain-containing protein [Trichonephila clavipes]